MTEETLTNVVAPTTDAKANGRVASATIDAQPAEPDPLAKRFLNIRTLLSDTLRDSMAGAPTLAELEERLRVDTQCLDDLADRLRSSAGVKH